MAARSSFSRHRGSPARRSPAFCGSSILGHRGGTSRGVAPACSSCVCKGWAQGWGGLGKHGVLGSRRAPGERTRETWRLRPGALTFLSPVPSRSLSPSPQARRACLPAPAHTSLPLLSRAQVPGRGAPLLPLGRALRRITAPFPRLFLPWISAATSVSLRPGGGEDEAGVSGWGGTLDLSGRRGPPSSAGDSPPRCTCPRPPPARAGGGGEEWACSPAWRTRLRRSGRWSPGGAAGRLALGVPLVTYLTDSNYFPLLPKKSHDRPTLFNRCLIFQ
jgi:hypothetical protein